MSLAKSIAKNTVFLGLGKFFSTALGIFTIAILLRYLSPEDYGRYTTVIAFILLFGTFADLGLNLTTTQDISLPETDVQKTISSVLTLRILINAILVVSLPAILYFFPYDKTVKIGIMIVSVLFFTQSLLQILSSYFQKSLKAEKIAISEFFGKLILFILTLVGCYLGFSFFQIIWIVSISSMAQFLILFKFAQDSIKIKLEFDTAIWKRILSKTWPVALSVVFTTIYFKGDTIILSLARPYEDVGIYGVAYKILEVLITLPIILMGLVLPSLTKAFSEKNMERFNEISQKTFDSLCIMAAPMTAGTIILADKIILLIAGQGYEDSANTLRILICATYVIFLGSLFSHAIVAINKQKQMIKYYALVAVSSLVLYALYIPRYSYYAAATVTVVAELAIALAAFGKVKKTSNFNLSKKTLIKTTIFSALMAGAMFPFVNYNIIIPIALGALVYFILIISTKTHEYAFNNVFRKNK